MLMRNAEKINDITVAKPTVLTFHLKLEMAHHAVHESFGH